LSNKYQNYIGYVLEKFYNVKSDHYQVADLIIICHTKDLNKIPTLLTNWQKNILESISSIILVTNDTTKISSNVAQRIDYVMSDNDFPEVIEFNKILSEHPQKSWYTQQILKILVRKHSNKYIVIDADTLLIQPHQFFENGVPIVRISHESGISYRNFENMLGLVNDPRSYIPHMGAFTSETVDEYCKFIEKNGTLQWYEVIARFLISDIGSYSEWNSFNKFLLQHYGANTRYWTNKSEQSDLTTYSPKFVDLLFRTSVSFHQPHAQQK